jgi:uncharacterized protein (DUF1015 family)
MATIVPFRALRYNPARVSLQDVVTQPYDKISLAMQDSYYAASPYNLVRIILGKRNAGDDERNSVYTRGAANLRDWRAEGVLQADDSPSIYYYSQRFPLPGSTTQVSERRGFIALGKLEDYDAGIVHRHEQTLSGPKVDRLNLLLATRAHFGQIFMLYSDPKFEIESVLSPATAPDVDVTDEYGVQHRMWRVCDPAAVELVRNRMQDKKLIIADGHHRYETALNYRNQRRAEAGGPINPEAPYERVMMTFVNMDQEGLVILPTHRVVFGLPGFDVPSFVEKAREFFTVNPLKQRLDGTAATVLLQQKGAGSTALLAAMAAGDFLLEAKPGATDRVLGSLSPLQRRLDVIQLHKVLLERVLGISEEAIRNQTHINYLRGAEETLQRARTDASVNVAFLMNPCTMEQVRDISFAGEVMPQKSTDFFPKLLSGLTIYALE